MVDACAANGILPFYGPFGDIKDTVACEDQFRNAFLLGCVGAWSLHPVQIDIARKVFSPSPTDVRHARRVIEAMGDGTGAVMLDGKMEDDASVKQCQVMVELAEALAAKDPELAKAYADDAGGDGVRADRTTDPSLRPRRSVLYMPGANERALEKAAGLPADALILDLEDAVAPDAKAEARDRVCEAASSGRYGAREVAIRVNALDTPWHDDDLRAVAEAGPAAVVVPKVDSAATVHAVEKALDAGGAPDHTTIWAMLETPVACSCEPRRSVRRPSG